MIHVDDVLDLELPVAAEHVFVDAAAQIDRARGRAIHDLVDAVPGRPEMGFEIGHVRAKAREHEAAIKADSRHASHAERGIAEVEVFAVAARHGNRVEIAIGLEGPAVIGAAEQLRIALRLGADDGAAMTAAVVDHSDLAFVVAHEDDGHQPDARRDEIAGLGHQAVMPDIDPAAVEDPLHLEREDVRIAIERAVNAVGIDERP